jgi:hypothetical protein
MTKELKWTVRGKTVHMQGLTTTVPLRMPPLIRDKYFNRSAHNTNQRELADHERAHTGEPGYKVDHGELD